MTTAKSRRSLNKLKQEKLQEVREKIRKGDFKEFTEDLPEGGGLTVGFS